MKDNIVQVKNPRTGHYVKIDRLHGIIIPDEAVDFVHAGEVIECGACCPEKYQDCKELERIYPFLKCKCRCHTNMRSQNSKEIDTLN